MMNSDIRKSIQGELCEICCKKRTKTHLFFANCQHSGVCMQCGQKQLIQRLAQKEQPTCLWGCGKDMNQGEDGLFQYFTTTVKEQWTNYNKDVLKKNPNKAKIRNCKMPDCKGFIIKNRCLQCMHSYCERCKDFDHDPRVSCKSKKHKQIFEGISTCPQIECQFPFIKDKGCLHMTCKECKFQFCSQCSQPWKEGHYKVHGFSGRCQTFCYFVAENLCCCCYSKQ